MGIVVIFRSCSPTRLVVFCPVLVDTSSLYLPYPVQISPPNLLFVLLLLSNMQRLLMQNSVLLRIFTRVFKVELPGKERIVKYSTISSSRKHLQY